MTSLTLDPKTTALVLIDLQNGIVGRALAPRPASEVMRHARQLAEAFRARGAPVVYVHVLLGEIARLPVDAPPPAGSPPPPEASELSPDAGFQPGDLRVAKRQWGAFYATELDQLLRRRGISTIVLGGIATNMGVESTARAAAERGYAQVFAEEAMTTFSAEAHAFSINHILPRIGRVRNTQEILAALSTAGV
jgi:nicotinamidase-related amidase